ncbi:hypothetical protein MTO96_029078 [Rhipicephalus appendiculatus]
MTSLVEVRFLPIKNSLLRFAAGAMAVATYHIAGSGIALSHWQAAFLTVTGGVTTAVLLVEGVKSADGRLEVKQSTPAPDIYGQTPAVKISLGPQALTPQDVRHALAQEPFNNLGRYKATSKNCQFLIIHLLRHFGVPVPSSMRTFHWLRRKAMTHATILGAFLCGTVVGAVLS